MLDPVEKDDGGKAFAARCVFIVGPGVWPRPRSSARRHLLPSMACSMCAHLAAHEHLCGWMHSTHPAWRTLPQTAT